MSQDDIHAQSPPDSIDDFEIVLNDVETPAAAEGASGDKPVFIRLDASVRQQMVEYALTNTSCELGGMLIGTVKDGDPPIVVVEAMIPARYTDAVHASVTFTHETWQDIHAVKDRVYPEKKIIGWFHTHPGFGIFLSNYDMHIHKNFFNLDWQIAYVVDPRAGTEGFFRWENGEVQKTAEYEIFGATLPLTPVTAPVPQPVPVVSQWREPRNYVIAALLLVAAGLGYYHQKYVRTVQVKEPTRQETVAKPPETPLPPAPPVAAPKQPKAPPTPVPSQYYIVQPNDSLWLISQRYYGELDVPRGIAIIKAANGLRSSIIYTGTKLWVPGGKVPGEEIDGDADR